MIENANAHRNRSAGLLSEYTAADNAQRAHCSYFGTPSGPSWGWCQHCSLQGWHVTYKLSFWVNLAQSKHYVVRVVRVRVHAVEPGIVDTWPAAHSAGSHSQDYDHIGKEQASTSRHSRRDNILVHKLLAQLKPAGHELHSVYAMDVRAKDTCP